MTIQNASIYIALKENKTFEHDVGNVSAKEAPPSHPSESEY